MKTCFADRETRSIVDLVRPGELTAHWTITRISVPEQHRSKGVGTALLERVLAEADAEQVTLELEPYPSGGLSYAQLVSWYEYHGFVMTRTGYMRRAPE